MIAAHLQTVAVSQLDVPFVAVVYAVAALGGLQIDVRHVGILAQCLPEHLALIVAHVYAVYVCACVLALHVAQHLGKEGHGQKQGQNGGQ